MIPSKSETDAKSRRPDAGLAIPLSSRNAAAFVGRTERGPVDTAVTVRNYNHFRQVFGGHATYSFVSYAVQHFFLHGGKLAVVVRVANRANRALIRVPAGAGVLELEARQPGSREYVRVSIDYDGFEDQPQLFNLIAQRLSRPGSHLIEDQEIYSGASVNPVDERCIAELLKGSRLLGMRGMLPDQRPDATRAKHPGDPIPYLEAAVQGSDGVEVTDYDIIGSREEGTGIFSLDAIDRVDLLCIPPPPGRDHGITSFLAAQRYCESRRAVLIWDPPGAWTSAETALSGARGMPMQGPNAVTYFPRIRSRLERVGLPTVLPACGALAGILATKAAYGEWTEGSATDPLLKISLAPTVDVDERETAALNRSGINVLSATEYGGAAFLGNVTLAASDDGSGIWRHLNRRRLLWFILDSLETAGRGVAENDVESVGALGTRVAEFLESLYERDALAGSNAAQALVVRRFAAAQREEAGIRCLRVGFALEKPREFLFYDLLISGGRCRVVQAPALQGRQLAG